MPEPDEESFISRSRRTARRDHRGRTLGQVWRSGNFGAGDILRSAHRRRRTLMSPSPSGGSDRDIAGGRVVTRPRWRSRVKDKARPSGAPSPCNNSLMWRATVLTLFPEMFPGPLGCRCGDALARRRLGLETRQLANNGLGAIAPWTITPRAADRHGDARRRSCPPSTPPRTDDWVPVLLMSPRARH